MEFTNEDITVILMALLYFIVIAATIYMIPKINQVIELPIGCWLLVITGITILFFPYSIIGLIVVGVGIYLSNGWYKR